MIKPVYSQYDYQQDRWLWGLLKDDFQKIQEGYACGKCLEDYNGVWVAACPVCGHPNEVQPVIQTPSEWR